MLDNVNDFGGYVVHFGLGIEAAQPETDGAVSYIVAEPQDFST